MSTHAFQDVVKDHKRRILATVCRAGVPPNEADDAAQEALLAIHVSLPRYDAARALEPWLDTIVRRRAAIFAKRRLRRLDREPLLQTGEEELIDPSGPEAHLPLSEALSEAHRILQTLDDDLRAVFLMAEVDKLPWEVIAGELGITVGKVQSWLRRAGEEVAKARSGGLDRAQCNGMPRRSG